MDMIPRSYPQRRCQENWLPWKDDPTLARLSLLEGFLLFYAIAPSSFPKNSMDSDPRLGLVQTYPFQFGTSGCGKVRAVIWAKPFLSVITGSERQRSLLLEHR